MWWKRKKKDTLNKAEKELIERQKCQKSDRVNWERVKDERKAFLDKLKIAIHVAGGRADNRWDEMYLDEVFTNLLPNGIEITFKFTGSYPQLRKYQEKLEAFQDQGEGDVGAFLYPDEAKKF